MDDIDYRNGGGLRAQAQKRDRRSVTGPEVKNGFSAYEAVSSLSNAFQFNGLRGLPWFKRIYPNHSDGTPGTRWSQT